MWLKGLAVEPGGIRTAIAAPPGSVFRFLEKGLNENHDAASWEKSNVVQQLITRPLRQEQAPMVGWETDLKRDAYKDKGGWRMAVAVSRSRTLLLGFV